MTQPSHPNLSMHGAVDLSGLAPAAGGPGGSAPSAPATPGAAGAPGAAGDSQVVEGPYSLTLGEANLEVVVRTSTVVPVVVVVTSARAQGSERLAADFAEFAAETEGRFQVATLDADAEAGIAGALGVQGLPATLVLLGGRPLPIFEGMAEREQVRDVVTQVLAAAAQSGLTGRVSGAGEGEAPEPAPEPVDPHMEAGTQALERGDLEAAVAAFEKAAIENPRSDEPRAALAQVHLLQRLADVDPDAAIRAAAEGEPSDVALQLPAADAELASGRAAEALERVLRVVTLTYGEDKETARKRLLELFDVVGPQDPVVSDVRRRLASALY